MSISPTAYIAFFFSARLRASYGDDSVLKTDTDNRLFQDPVTRTKVLHGWMLPFGPPKLRIITPNFCVEEYQGSPPLKFHYANSASFILADSLVQILNVSL